MKRPALHTKSILYSPRDRQQKNCFPSNALLATSTSPMLLRLTESKSLAGLANNSSLDVLAAKESVLVGNGLESASGSRVLGRAEVVVALDGVALLLGELRGEGFLDVDEDVALDEGLGACWEFWVSECFLRLGILLLFNVPILVLIAVSPTVPPS